MILAGIFQNWTGDIFRAWSILFICLSILFLIFALYHSWRLPHPKSDSSKQDLNINKIFQNYLKIFKSFFTKPNAIAAISFMLLYRLGEAQLSKIAQSCGIPSKTESSLKSAFKSIAKENDNAIIFCTGSLYFAGEILNLN